MAYDLLLKGGWVIDPANGIDERRDVAVFNGKVAAVEREIPFAAAAKVIDVSRLYVTPGLVDLHCHLYATAGMRDAWAGDNSVLPDGFSFRTGVTTMVDAGSSGWRNFADFRDRVIDRAVTRVYAMLNIVGLGMMTDIPEQNPLDMEPERTAKMAEEHRDVVVGIKTAHYFGPEWIAIERAVAAGEISGLPAMVDVGYFRVERPFHQMVTEKLRPGDIATHMYRAPVPYVGKDGKLLPYFFAARRRGVIFDVGHGGGSFVFRSAAPSIAQGFYPDTISTDLHTTSMNGAMMDITTVISKFLALGMSLAEAIKETTVNPARLIGHPELGTLTVGGIADIAVFNLMAGEFGYYDSGGGKLQGKQRLITELTLKDGKIVWDWNARAAVDYRTLGEFYDVRSMDQVVFPEA